MRKKNIICCSLILSLLFSVSLFAGEKESINLADKFKTYFNDVSLKVKKENDPSVKREILNSSIEKFDDVLLKVIESPGIPEKDIAVLKDIQSNINNKYAELNGLNGYEKIKDNQLNDYSNYLVQDLEQADKYVVISLTTLLLVAILLILLL